MGGLPHSTLERAAAPSSVGGGNLLVDELVGYGELDLEACDAG